MIFLLLFFSLLTFHCCENKISKPMLPSVSYEDNHIYIPIWVNKALDKEGLNLTDKEIKSLTLLDINGDKIVDAIFIKNNSLILVEKKKGVSNLTLIKNNDGEVLDDYNWVDFWYIDDPLKSNTYPFIYSKGQVLILGKESSGIIAIYYDNDYKWVSYD